MIFKKKYGGVNCLIYFLLKGKEICYFRKNLFYCFMGSSQYGMWDSVERLILDNSQTG